MPIKNYAGNYRQYKTLKQFATHFEWTTQTFRGYQRIKTELRERCKETYNKIGRIELTKYQKTHKKSKQFWNKIKLLKGKKTPHTNYMKDKDGNKYFTDKEKCNLMEETWENVFKITEEEENSLHKQHSDHINRYITVNNNRIKSFPTANTERLDNENYLTREITIEEVKMYIRRTKKESSRLN